jgi:hypothetical protein
MFKCFCIIFISALFLNKDLKSQIFKEINRFGLVGLQNSKGKLLRPIGEFEYFSPINDTLNFIIGKKDYKDYIINDKGIVLNKNGFTDVYYLTKEVFRIQQNDLYYLMNSKGTILTPKGYHQIGGIQNGLLSVYDDKQGNGLINLKGEEVIAPKYRSIGAICNGYFACNLDGKYGVADINGNYLIEPNYKKINRFNANRNLIKITDSTWGIMDDNKNWITKNIRCNELEVWSSNDDWLFIKTYNNNISIINIDGLTLQDSTRIEELTVLNNLFINYYKGETIVVAKSGGIVQKMKNCNFIYQNKFIGLSI